MYLINTVACPFLKVRDEIEQLLDDDGDMAEMYLTDKLLAQQEDSVSPSSPDHGFGSVSPSGYSHAPSTLPPFNLEDPTLQSDGKVSDGEDEYVYYLGLSLSVPSGLEIFFRFILYWLLDVARCESNQPEN